MTDRCKNGDKEILFKTVSSERGYMMIEKVNLSGINTTQVPLYWKSTLSDIDDAMKNIKRGKVSIVGKSAGGRPIYLVEYGKRASLGERTANYSSACGAHDLNCYADKSSPDYTPSLFLMGPVHGGEMEGIAGILSLFSVLETGKDLKGDSYPEIYNAPEKMHFAIIPCGNPDGRARVPLAHFVGESLETLRYYNQGTWKDGSLCFWPDCKKVHPIKNAVDFLGAYYNDDGINIVHDNFFDPKSNEVKILYKIADQYAPDLMIQLHGGSNTRNTFLRPYYVPEFLTEIMDSFEECWYNKCTENGLACNKWGPRDMSKYPPFEFSVTSALTHLCGAPALIYETNQGIAYGDIINTYPEWNRHPFTIEDIF